MGAAGPVVLIVEGESPVREVIAEALQERGFQVLPAANGAAALELLDTVGSDVGA